jgi:hypothetical protein
MNPSHKGVSKRVKASLLKNLRFVEFRDHVPTLMYVSVFAYFQQTVTAEQGHVTT